MARGFESKSVADQQEAAEREPRPRQVPAGSAPAALARRHRLELARVDLLRRIESAHSRPHLEMLRRALVALDQELSQ